MTTESSEQSGVEEFLRPWVVVGAGRLGRALALAGRRKGVSIRATWNRTAERAEETAELCGPGTAASGSLPGALREVDLSGAVVWLTVVDEAVSTTAERLAGRLREAGVVFHAAGALDSSRLREAGIEAPVGSLHPLLAVADPEAAARRFGDVTWSVEGDGPAVEFGRRFTRVFGARCLELPPGARARYHASAATAANLLVALADAALEMATYSGLNREEARAALLPLMESAVENLRSKSTEEALSGPVARGDEATVERHLAALDETPEMQDLYRALTERARQLVASED